MATSALQAKDNITNLPCWINCSLFARGTFEDSLVDLLGVSRRHFTNQVLLAFNLDLGRMLDVSNWIGASSGSFGPQRSPLLRKDQSKTALELRKSETSNPVLIQNRDIWPQSDHTFRSQFKTRMNKDKIPCGTLSEFENESSFPLFYCECHWFLTIACHSPIDLFGRAEETTSLVGGWLPKQPVESTTLAGWRFYTKSHTNHLAETK